MATIISYGDQGSGTSATSLACQMLNTISGIGEKSVSWRIESNKNALFLYDAEAASGQK